MRVVAAVLEGEAEGEVLVFRRHEGKRFGGRWEFPGGKVDPGESDPQALKRELIEELAVEVEVGEHLFCGRPADPPGMEVHFYRCRVVDGSELHVGVADKPDHDDMTSATFRTLRERFDLAPGDVEFVEWAVAATPV